MSKSRDPWRPCSISRFAACTIYFLCNSVPGGYSVSICREPSPTRETPGTQEMTVPASRGAEYSLVWLWSEFGSECVCLVRKRRDLARPGCCGYEVFLEEVGLGLDRRTLQSHSWWEPQSVWMGCPVPVCSGICCVWGSVQGKSPSLHGGIISPRQQCLWPSSLQGTVCHRAWQVRHLLGGHLERQEEAGARG